MSIKTAMPSSAQFWRSASRKLASPSPHYPRITQPYEALRLLEKMPQSKQSVLSCKLPINSPLANWSRISQPYESLRFLEKKPNSTIPQLEPSPLSHQRSISPVYGQEPWMNVLQMMNRNNRKPRNANHGKRPCSRYARRKKARRYGNPRRGRG